MFETLLALITRAVVALEKLAEAGPAPQQAAAPESATKPAGKRKTAAAETAPPAGDDDFLGGEPEAKEPEVKYERADVKKALQDYGAKHGMPKAQELFKSVSGVTSLSDLPIEKFAAVINATKK